MAALKIYNIFAFGTGFSSKTSGEVEASFGDQRLKIPLTEDEAAEILSIALRIAQSRQQDLAKQIADAQPELLPAPNCVEGEFTAVDDIPF